MEYFTRIFTFILACTVSNLCKSQVGADAGTDTAVANPVFKEYFFDSAVFHLTVTDSNDGSAYDSVRV